MDDGLRLVIEGYISSCFFFSWDLEMKVIFIDITLFSLSLRLLNLWEGFYLEQGLIVHFHGGTFPQSTWLLGLFPVELLVYFLVSFEKIVRMKLQVLSHIFRGYVAMRELES